ncbi:hypothetical protein IB286_11825 [Spongiibacter sp. KMU-158]|uniref:Uncharacterized protein n=1 Tax=Spongiibacter pelagi TaxID=2760804 RepID=A0A927C505_9GAMM|nr:hypothetical protein [Spongiibacter pelagi]MBD2859691.1 hypothetical protein [Spongiibacter pelagi]
MSIGSWTPENEKAKLEIEPEWLRRCLSLSGDAALAALPSPFTEAEQQQYSAFMRFSPEHWQQAVASFSNDELRTLMRFFAVAEWRISGWDAGDQSPVIWINRVLRQRGEKLTREELLWLRANSENRFIPNGAL